MSLAPKIQLLIALAVLLTSCAGPEAAGTPSPQRESHDIRSRFAELAAAGTPEKITAEFSREDLVREAPVLFEYHLQHGPLHLYTDRPFQEENGKQILTEVEKRLQRSPLYRGEKNAAFICNDPWKEDFFLRGSKKIGGDNHYPMAPHAFLTRALVDEDALYSPQGRPIAPPRTLTYYLAHEFTHTVMGQSLGDKNWKKLPHWIFEGYPDYIGLGPSYNYETALKAYQNRDPRVNGTMAEDYLRYGVMVAYALEKKGLSAPELVENPPDEAELIRASGLVDVHL